MEAITHNKILRLLRTYLFKAKCVWYLDKCIKHANKINFKACLLNNTKNKLNCSPAVKNLTLAVPNHFKMNSINLNITFEQYAGISELTLADRTLCEHSERALHTSYSPYSKFRVGTAIRLSSGDIILGSNQENLAYPSGLCAERVALFSIGATNPDAVIESMAITAQTDNFEILKPVTSCGGCLQVMVEFERKQNTPIEVIFYCLNGEVLKVPSVKSLIPFAFVEDRLER